MLKSVHDRSDRSAAGRHRLPRAEIWLQARLLPLLITNWDFKSALRYSHAKPCLRFSNLSVEQIADWIVQATRHPIFMRDRRCLRQGLLGARFMRMAGHEPELHFGIDSCSLKKSRLNAHCWVVINGSEVLNTALDDMVVIHIDTSNAAPV